MVSERLIAQASAAIACITCVALFLESRDLAPRQLRQPVALLLLVAAVATYAHFFQSPQRTFYHRWEMFHYFLGSKYAGELGYQRLYVCTAVADAETNPEQPLQKRRLRDLRDDAIVPAVVAVAGTNDCRARFSAARWQDFKSDVRFFRGQVEPRRWQQMLLDHGYNPAPAWTLLGRALSARGKASSSFLGLLALLDPLLMLATLGALAWGFGARVAWLAAMFWSCQAASTFAWTGGGFLRQDWLFFVALSLALLRRGRPFGAGAALGWASALRVFPVLLFAGPALLTLFGLWRGHRFSRSQRAFVLGGFSCLVVSLGVTLRAFGYEYHREFAQHIAMHAETPVANHMGLRSLLSLGPESRIKENAQPQSVDPTQRWAAARRAHFSRWRSVYFLLGGLSVVSLALTVRRLNTLWMSMPLSLLLVAVLTDPSCYYFSLWLIAAVLVSVRRAVAMPLMGLAAAGQLLVLAIAETDLQYAALAAAYLAFSALLVCLFARPRFGVASSLHCTGAGGADA